jgi:hypothetical protein
VLLPYKAAAAHRSVDEAAVRTLTGDLAQKRVAANNQPPPRSSTLVTPVARQRETS